MQSAMQAYAYDEHRDASPTIRGFYYQFLLCLELWLELQPGEALLLEQGEDIDRLVNDAGGDDSKLRELIQVKDIGRSITIRSAAAREALANYHHHRLSNQTTKLKYVFYTSASAGRDRPRISQLGSSMVELWNDAPTWPVGSPQREQFTDALRSFLREAPLPDGYDEVRWRDLKNFATGCTNVALWDFVGSLRWAIDQGDWKARNDRVRELIDDANLLGANQSGELLISFLVTRLLQKVSQKDRSALTKESLDAAIADFGQETNPRGTWEDVHRELAALSSEIQALSNRVAQVERQQAVLTVQLNQDLAGGETVGAQIALVGQSEFAPALPPHVAPRTAVVGRVCQSLTPRGAGVIWGPAAQGKTTLALLVARQLGLDVVWLEASPQNGEPAEAFLWNQLESVATRPFTPRDHEWLQDTCRLISFRGLLILDRLPESSHDHPLFLLVAAVVSCVLKFGGKVLCVGHAEPRGQVWEQWERLGAFKLAAPELTAADVVAIAASLGAPPQFVEGRLCALIASLSRGHPVLVQASLQFMRDRQWKQTSTDVEALLKGDFKDEVLRQTIRRLAGSVANPETRTLLYRLDVVGGAISSAMAVKVARVSPEIGRANEHFGELVGAWLRRVSGEKYEVTPLLAGTGHAQLHGDELKGVHRVAADELLSEGRLSHNEALIVLNHLRGAGDHGRFVRLFIEALQNALLHALDKPDLVRSASGLLLNAWVGSPLPEGIAAHYRLYIRASQVAVRRRVGLQTDPLVEEFVQLFADVSAEWMDHKVLSAILFIQSHSKDRFEQCVGLALSLNTAWPALDESADDRRRSLYTSARVWIAMGLSLGDKTLDQAKLFFLYLNAMSPSEVTALEQAGSHYPVYWLPLLASTENLRGADALAAAADLVQISGQLAGNGHQSVAAAISSRTYYVRIRGKEDPQVVMSDGLKAVDRLEGDSRTQVWLLSELGEGLFAEGLDAEALQVYANALHKPGWDDAHDRVTAALFAAVSADRLERAADRLTYTRMATEVFNSADRLVHSMPHDELVARGEHALALWEEGERVRAIREIERALGTLFGKAALSREERAAALSIRMMLGAVTPFELGLRGQNPAGSVAELRNHMRAGAFLHDYDNRAAKYTLTMNLESLANLAALSEAVGDLNVAERTAREAYSQSRQVDDRFRECLMGLQISTVLLREDRIEEVLDIGCRGAAWFIASKTLDAKATAEHIGSGEVATVLRDLPQGEIRALVEFALIMGVIPALCAITARRLIDGAPFADQVSRVARVRGLMPMVNDHATWRAIMDLIDAFAEGKMPWQEVIKQCKDNQGVTDSVAGVAIATLLSMLDTTMPLRQTFGSFCALGRTLEPMAKFPISIYERHFSDLVEKYWPIQLQQRRFQFRTPDLISAQLAEALAKPRPVRTKAILRAVSNGFRATLPPDIDAWLRSDQQPA